MPLSADDIAKILKACKQSGVTHLKMGELDVKFLSSQEWDAQEQKDKRRKPDPIPDAKELEDAQRRMILQTNADQADDDVASLLIEDPVAFEQLVVERELGEREAAKH